MATCASGARATARGDAKRVYDFRVGDRQQLSEGETLRGVKRLGNRRAGFRARKE